MIVFEPTIPVVETSLYDAVFDHGHSSMNDDGQLPLKVKEKLAIEQSSLMIVMHCTLQCNRSACHSMHESIHDRLTIECIRMKPYETTSIEIMPTGSSGAS